MRVAWRRASQSLDPVVVAGRAMVGETLAFRAQRLLSSGDAVTLSRLGEWTVVQADRGTLPWADGCVFLGQLPGATGVFVPVHFVPDVPADILAAAIRRIAAPAGGPFLLLLREEEGGVTVLALGGPGGA
jgi:MoxR-vWA-beta-propeller ternary system protein